MILKFIKWIVVVFFLFVALAFAIPYFFKTKIVAKVKTEINNKLKAKVDFKDVEISLFKHFPKVSIGLQQLQITGIGPFATDTLIAAKNIEGTVDIISFFKGSQMTIYSIYADAPRIHALVHKNGLTNWDILIPDTSAVADHASKPFNIALKKYAINNAYIQYKDDVSNINTIIENLNHEGKGDFTADLFTLSTNTKADAVTIIYGGIPYLYKTPSNIDVDIQVDNKNKTYSFNTDNINVSALKINGKGTVKDLADKGYNMDISFNAPSTDFKHFLSLIPAVYKNDFDKLKTSGAAMFNGEIKGIYNENTIPSYKVNLEIKNGFFQYPDLPRPLKQINVTARIQNPDGKPDHTVVNIEKAHFEMDNEPFDFRLFVKNPVTNIFIDAAANGKLNLGKVTQFVKLEQGTAINGLLVANVNIKGNLNDIKQQKYNQFTAGGNVEVSNFSYVSKDYPRGVKINRLSSSFSPSKVTLSNVTGQYLGTNFSANGQINNLLNYMFQNQSLNASFSINADYVNLNDWMGTSTDSSAKGKSAAPFVVPGNLDIVLNSSINKVHYDKIDISNLSGSLKIKDETVSLNNVKGNALDGTMTINGSYSTKQSKTKPDIAMMYNVEKVDVQKTFNAFNTVQQLMPIGKFIAGKLTSQLSLRGKLGENMLPEMNTLSGSGNLLLIEGLLSKFAPLEKIANTLNIKSLEQISLKEVKNYFEFSNGKLLVKPYNLKVNNIDMEIAGMQGFDQSLDYIINMKLPRSLMGVQGNQLVNTLVTQANNKGLPLKVGEVVNLNIKLGGFFKSPTVKTDLKQSAENLTTQLKQQALDFAKSKIDSTKKAVTNAVKDTVASIKKQVISTAKEEITRQLLGGTKNNTDSAKPAPKPVEAVKGLINGFFKKKSKDTTNH